MPQRHRPVLHQRELRYEPIASLKHQQSKLSRADASGKQRRLTNDVTGNTIVNHE
jgi:hypothetical protein